MSSLSISRQRDRGGGGSVRIGTKPLTPSSISSYRHPSPSMKNSSSGKENPNPKPVIRSQKPVIKSVPRAEKGVVEKGESRVRLSSSSVVKGRSQSPSEFIRVYSDLKRDGLSRASVGRKGIRDSSGKGDELVGNQRRGSGEFKCNDRAGVNLEKKSDSERQHTGVRVLGSNCSKGDKFCANLGKSCVNRSSVSRNEKGCSILKEEKCEKVDILNSDDQLEIIDQTVHSRLNEYSDKISIDSKVSETLREKGLSEGVSTTVGVKFSSKLHEKLTFLEGKVKRIQSDIKRTKEILDMNNPDASKVILSDIQEKISGIEMAMGNVAADPVGKSVGNNDEESKAVEMSQGKIVDSVKDPVMGLTSEELEARLFPHHKMLRNRMSIKLSSGTSQDDELNDGQGSDSKVDGKLMSPIEDNPIAAEFLASLNKDINKFTARNGLVNLECDEILETDEAAKSGKQGQSSMFSGKGNAEFILTSDERLDEFDNQENRQEFMTGDEIEETCSNQLNEIGQRTSTGGWFLSEGESVLLAHGDGSCSYYDIAHGEEKAVYNPPTKVSHSIWRDCWIIRAASSDGCSGRYVVVASAGNTSDSGFCSWDFYTKDVRAFHIEGEGTTSSRTILGPRNALSDASISETCQWWYRPCGPLIAATASSQRVVTIYDIRDGEQIMQWEVPKPVLTMDYSSPVQWRNRGKLVMGGVETISLWDVNSQNPRPLLSVSSCGQKISALHVNNTDAELGGGVRHRVSSAEAEGNDGVFCTPDSINVMDFRHPCGVGLKIPKVGITTQSVFSRGDSIYIGCANVRSTGKKQPSSSQVQQFSLRKQRLLNTYSLPESNAHSYYSAITQVWGNANLVMATCGQGLFVYDALHNDGYQTSTSGSSSTRKVREIIGPDDLFAPSFDYLASRVLLISRDRPALWRYLP